MNDFGLSTALAEIWRQRWVVAVGLGGALAIGLLAVLVLGRSYTATMVVAPEPSSLSLEPERFNPSALLGMAGADSASPIEVYTTLLTSRSVADRIAQNQPLMRQIFPGAWDEKKQRWRRPPGVVEAVKDFVRLVLGRRAWTAPDGFAVQSFLKGIRIAPVKSNFISASSIHKISYTARNGYLAQQVLLAIHRAAVDVLRENHRVKVESQIEFLSGELNRPYSSETREALIRALGTLLQRRVMLSSQGDYAIMLVDPPSFSPTPSFPIPTLILGSSFVFGALASGLLVLVFWGKALPPVLVASHRPRHRQRPTAPGKSRGPRSAMDMPGPASSASGGEEFRHPKPTSRAAGE